MRKTVTKGFSALLALALALTLLCTGALAESSATYPLFDEPVTITSVVVGKDMTHDRSLWTELGKLCGVPTPTMDGVISIYSVAHSRDWRGEGIKLDRMGLDGMTVAEIRSFLKTGKK